MTGLSGLTGFELFVVASLFEMSASFAEARFKRTDKAGDALSMGLNAICSFVVWGYWIVVAVWPAIT